MTIILGFLNFAIGVLYPAWSSLEALGSDDPVDDAQWLTYWLSYAFLLIVEYPLDIVIKLIPLYELFRICILLWLTLPFVHGAEWLYETILQPGFQLLKSWLGEAPALNGLKPKKPPPPPPESDDTASAKDQSSGNFNDKLRRALS